MTPISLLPFLFITAAFLFPFRAAEAGTFRVVLDPGHGGVDHGTSATEDGKRFTEKEATLALALEVARQLRAKGIQATLTREKDQDVSLGARTALANRIGADLFLSIHMNSSADAAAHPVSASAGNGSGSPSGGPSGGIETYILNNTTDESSRRLAHLENTVLGDDSDGAENPDVALILRDLKLDANLSESKRLACAVQDSLITSLAKARRPAKDRGVKQALFHVLLGAEMPSALLEAGFLSNARDRELVAAPQGRALMARAIAGAIDQFRKLRGTRAALSALGRCKVN